MSVVTGGLITAGVVAIMLAAIWWGWIGVAILLLLMAAAGFIWYVEHYVDIRVPEMEVAVIFNTRKKAFVRFLPHGRHWIAPLVERVKDRIPLGAQMVNAVCQNANTAGGIPVNIEWSMSYALDPFKLSPDMKPKMARALPRYSGSMAQSHGNNCLQHVVEELSVSDLHKSGARLALEVKFKQAAQERLDMFGFVIHRVMINAIHFPPQVEAALEEAFERKVQVESEVHALTALKQVVSGFSERDMERLAELERMRLLGRNGVTLVYPLSAMQGALVNPAAVEKSTETLPAEIEKALSRQK